MTTLNNLDTIGPREFSILNSLRKKAGLSFVSNDEDISRLEYQGTVVKLLKKLGRIT